MFAKAWYVWVQQDKVNSLYMLLQCKTLLPEASVQILIYPVFAYLCCSSFGVKIKYRLNHTCTVQIRIHYYNNINNNDNNNNNNNDDDDDDDDDDDNDNNNCHELLKQLKV